MFFLYSYIVLYFTGTYCLCVIHEEARMVDCDMFLGWRSGCLHTGFCCNMVSIWDKEMLPPFFLLCLLILNLFLVVSRLTGCCVWVSSSIETTWSCFCSNIVSLIFSITPHTLISRKLFSTALMFNYFVNFN